MAALAALAAVVSLVACSPDAAEETQDSAPLTIPEPTSDTPVESAAPLVEQMGCDDVVEVRMSWLRYRLEQTLECSSGGEYIGRLHIFDASVSRDDLEEQSGIWERYDISDVQPDDCFARSPGVVVGDGWAVVVTSEDAAPAMATTLNGTVVTPRSSGPLVSYLSLPCEEM